MAMGGMGGGRPGGGGFRGVDEAAQKKLNAEGKQITVFEGMSGETVIGTGITRTKKQQMEALSYNAVKRVEEWLLENPEWFDMTKEELEAAMAARSTAMKGAKKAAAAEAAAAGADVAGPTATATATTTASSAN